jgi:predicted transcriptional regulator
MIITKRKFEVIKPSKNLRKLTILSELSINPRMSQRKLASLVAITSTMVNNYMQELANENLIVKNGETNRSFEYCLTDKGSCEKRKLLTEAWTELIQIFGIIKNELGSIISNFKQNGINELALFGAAETAELTYVVCKMLRVKVEAIFDSDQSKWNNYLIDLPIYAPAKVNDLKCKNILITSMGHTGEIEDTIRKMRTDLNILTLV